MTERDKIAARIRALLAKTVENGCTEDEAVAAAEKAAEMLARYNLTVDEVQMRESPFTRHTESHRDWTADRLWKVAAAIADLTGARYWTSARGVWPVEINFFGFEHEVDVAKYLFAICSRAMDGQVDRLDFAYRMLRTEVRRRKIIPFIDGMADRLHQRITALKPPQPTGRGLIVLRNALITAAMADAGIKTKSSATRRSRDLDEAYIDGLNAGDRVSLNRGIRGTSAVHGFLT